MQLLAVSQTEDKAEYNVSAIGQTGKTYFTRT